MHGLSVASKYISSQIGIVCSDGEEWKSQRKVTAQILSAKAIREHSNEGLNREVQKILDYFDKAAASGSEVDFHELMHAFSLDAFGR
jgi:cytochrome P450